MGLAVVRTASEAPTLNFQAETQHRGLVEGQNQRRTLFCFCACSCYLKWRCYRCRILLREEWAEVGGVREEADPMAGKDCYSSSVAWKIGLRVVVASGRPGVRR